MNATKVAVFSITLDDESRIWFWTIVEGLMTYFDYVIEEFLTNFAWHVNKWNPIDQLFSLKLKVKETIGDYIHHTKSLQSRCNIGDKIFDNKLMSRFINGLYDLTLQNVLA